MSAAITEKSLFKPKASKADTTDRTARDIIMAEAQRQEAKTARLREARLEREATSVAEEMPAKPRKAKTSAPRRAKSS